MELQPRALIHDDRTQKIAFRIHCDSGAAGGIVMDRYRLIAKRIGEFVRNLFQLAERICTEKPISTRALPKVRPTPGRKQPRGSSLSGSTESRSSRGLLKS